MHYKHDELHPENSPEYKGLTVNQGVADAPIVNPYRQSRKKRRQYTADEYVAGILAGDIPLLGQAVTLVESALPEHQEMAQQVIERCLPHAGGAIRLGITDSTT